MRQSSEGSSSSREPRRSDGATARFIRVEWKMLERLQSPVTPFRNATTNRVVIDCIRESDYELACEIIPELLPLSINVALIID